MTDERKFRCEHEAAGIPREERALERGKWETFCPLCEERRNEELGRLLAGVPRRDTKAALAEFFAQSKEPV